MSPAPALRPFLKWAGGKTRLLPEIRRTYPAGLGRTVTRYAEPFVGGGAVLFDILSTYRLDEVYISDANMELVCAYRTIRDDVESLIGLLSEMRAAWRACPGEEGRSLLYYGARDRFNHLKVHGTPEDDVEKAALMVFLNKTCFNGLHRVNGKGLFNVPMGRCGNPAVFDERSLRAVSKALRNVHIVRGGYEASEAFIDDRTFAYFDPPYRPLSRTSAFTSYTEDGFDDEAQKALAAFVRRMAARGAHVVVSDSDPRNADPDDGFFDSLYAGFRIARVRAPRAVNCDGAKRGKVSELLIGNF